VQRLALSVRRWRTRATAVLGVGAIVASTLIVVGPAAAAPTGQYSIVVSPANTNTSSGATGVQVSVVADSGGQSIEGVSGSLTWGSGLTLTAITPGTAPVGPTGTWSSAPLPSVSTANTAQAIHGGGFFDGGSAGALAAANLTLFTATFTVSGTCSLSPITLGTPLGPVDGGYLDSGFNTVSNASINTTGATITFPCPTPTPVPTITPVPTATPTLAPANGQVSVTGSLDAGFLSLQCPTSLSIGLVRNLDNVKDFDCTIFSNIVWSLQVSDSKAPTAPVGHMTSGANSLADSMHVQDGASGTHNIDLASGGTVVPGGSNSVVQGLELQQFVGPADAPGAYSISLTFQAVGGF
jgi:hypothetical protein